ncbi:hypothetical protein RTBOTA2_002198 [Rhodotorula toruloides]|nr:hypothetical protein RTBOTA2_002198 [Rhodotorula toruloides]
MADLASKLSACKHGQPQFDQVRASASSSRRARGKWSSTVSTSRQLARWRVDGRDSSTLTARDGLRASQYPTSTSLACTASHLHHFASLALSNARQASDRPRTTPRWPARASRPPPSSTSPSSHHLPRTHPAFPSSSSPRSRQRRWFRLLGRGV